jgi:hypothetical protein
MAWRGFVVVAGALVLVVVSGMALGIVTVSSRGVGVNLGGTAGAAGQVRGVDGVYPGGPPMQVPVLVRNLGYGALEVTSMNADLSGLPDACPASAWRVSAPDLLPTVPGRAEATLLLPITLSPTAPDGCQSATVRFPVRAAGLRHAAPATSAQLVPDTLEGQATVTTATLGSPTTTPEVRDGAVVVTPGRPTGGPAPSGYDVLAVDGDRQTPICAGITGECPDRGAPSTVLRSYLVRARVGANWIRDGRSVKIWTPPPAPVLKLADPTRPSAGEWGLTAQAAAADYDVALYLDDAGTPFRTETVRAGSDLDVTVQGPVLRAGMHRVVAVSRFRGYRVASAPVQLSGGAPGRTAADVGHAATVARPTRASTHSHRASGVRPVIEPTPQDPGGGDATPEPIGSPSAPQPAPVAPDQTVPGSGSAGDSSGPVAPKL